MKIAFLDVTATVSFGGIQTAIWQLARELGNRGHAVSVYGGKGFICPDNDAQVDIRTYEFTPRDCFPNLGTRFRKLAERLSFARHARADVAAADLDWIILTKPFDFFWPRLIAADRLPRFAFMSGGTDFMPGDRWLAERVQVLTACSHYNAQQIRARFKRPVKVIYNGVDCGRFCTEMRDEARRSALGFAASDVVFVFAGRIIGLKGLHIAIRALASRQMAQHPAKLLLVGAGPALGGLKKLAQELNVADRICCHPALPQHELPALYACADAGIFPAVGEEAFGIAVAEAMACGLPVIASYSGGMPEVIGNEGNCGLLFTLGDVEECANAMATLCRDSSLRLSMGRAARQRIEAHFTWSQAADRLLTALAAADHPADTVFSSH